VVLGKLAKQANTVKSTASKYFEENFGGHKEYAHLCRTNPRGLARKLRSLGDELLSRRTLGDSANDVVDHRSISRLRA
jgi:hypothetical protein